MNNKASMWLTEEISKLVIAVVLFLVLVGLAVLLYNSFVKSSDLQKAENNVKSFASEFNSFISSGQKSHDFIILGPQNWVIVFYNNQIEATPTNCQNYRNCVCFCESATNPNDKSSSCRTGGVACAEINAYYKGVAWYLINQTSYNLHLEIQ